MTFTDSFAVSLILFASASSCMAGVFERSDELPTRPPLDVCFENPSAETERCESQTRAILESEYSLRAGLDIRFQPSCGSESAEIHIHWQRGKVNSVRTVERGVLTRIDLNLACRSDFSHSPELRLRRDCVSAKQQDLCTINLALHEFGHAVGLSHEDLRPESGREVRVDRDRYLVLTPYDATSIMNLTYYQDILGSRRLHLSELDLESIRRLRKGVLTMEPGECPPSYHYLASKRLCFIPER